MFLCYNSHGTGEGKKYWEDEMKYLSNEILKECRKYMKRDIKLSSINGEKILKYHITKKEINAINLEKLMFIFPIGFLGSLSEIVEDTVDFISRKFIQLCKILESDQIIDLDIFCQAILYCIMEKSNESLSDKIIQSEVAAYIEEIGNSDAKYAEEMYRKIFSSLHSLLNADEMGDVAIVYHNYDFKVLFDMNLKDAILLLFNKKTEYNIAYWDSVFNTIGIRIPFEFLEEYQSGKKHHTTLHLIDRSSDDKNKEKYINLPDANKKNRIVCFPENNIIRNEV